MCTLASLTIAAKWILVRCYDVRAGQLTTIQIRESRNGIQCAVMQTNKSAKVKREQRSKYTWIFFHSFYFSFSYGPHFVSNMLANQERRIYGRRFAKTKRLCHPFWFSMCVRCVCVYRIVCRSTSSTRAQHKHTRKCEKVKENLWNEFPFRFQVSTSHVPHIHLYFVRRFGRYKVCALKSNHLRALYFGRCYIVVLMRHVCGRLTSIGRYYFVWWPDNSPPVNSPNGQFAERKIRRQTIRRQTICRMVNSPNIF